MAMENKHVFYVLEVHAAQQYIKSRFLVFSTVNQKALERPMLRKQRCCISQGALQGLADAVALR